MRFLLPIILTLLTFQSPNVYSTPKCGIEVLKNISSKMDSLSENDFHMFFGSFSPKCSNNVEFSEWSNELLFEALLKHPVLFINILPQQDKSFINKALEVLESPIHDGIDVSSTYAAVKKSQANTYTKDSILSALKTAGEKSGLILK